MVVCDVSKTMGVCLAGFSKRDRMISCWLSAPLLCQLYHVELLRSRNPSGHISALESFFSKEILEGGYDPFIHSAFVHEKVKMEFSNAFTNG
ncbi:hypothetical protein Tco_1032767 [Tanacetum coccineum]|uniref:Uncharacterized protein n=1 Tax=Tanacetum coccineum TaxID=301880 RepID=A0ABQ5GE64_9ASTR